MIEVLRGGVLTTVQDLGRPGWQSSGVPVGGALDTIALRVANVIVGNDDAAAGLECTARGPVLRFLMPARIALCGADVDGVAMRRPLLFAAGEELSLEGIRRGGRVYMSVAGGIAVPRVLGSRSTHLAGGFGGCGGRALRAGDRLPVGTTDNLSWARGAPAHWSVAESMVPELLSEHVVLRAVAGPQEDWFDEDARRRFWDAEFVVDSKSDRMGLRVSGDSILPEGPRNMISEPVAFGSVQVPPDGLPIILLADRQTLGGYPKIATVISADRPKLARLHPGQRISFGQVSLVEAQYHRMVMDTAFAALRAGLAEMGS